MIFSLILNFPVTQAKTLVSEQAKVGARSVWGQNGKRVGRGQIEITPTAEDKVF